ncbi:hypothetical protein [Arhodomonas sp. SL1]|uniref:hypothetical protein n=1 Tax=Arhodomonas sp. SL1 TaxID=3425691 RepID=UPI003F884F72
MRHGLHILSLLALVLWAGNAAAQATEGGWHSPMRPQLELTTELSEALNVRFGVSSSSAAAENGQWRVAPPTQPEGVSASALVDWDLPTAEGVRVTGGAFYGSGEWGWPGGVAASGDYDPPSYRFEEDSEWTPYVGLGWDQQFGEERRFGLQLDMGVKFEGVSDLEGDDQLRRLREEAELSTRFESFRYVPMFSAGLEYRF